MKVSESPIGAKTAILLVLRTRPASTACEIAQRVKARAGIVLGGKLFPALRALEERRLITSKPYAITGLGSFRAEGIARVLRAIVETDPKRNPNFKRPADWKFEEDYGSPAWEERRARDVAVRQALVEEFGFDVCPKCSEQHTGKTWRCRTCGYLEERAVPKAGAASA